MATYAWTISKLYTKDITKDGTTYTDAILRVTASIVGTSETIGSVNAVGGFDIDMNVDNISDGFTAYTNVTKANVVSWIESRVGSETIANIKSQIEKELEFLEKINGANGKVDSDDNPTFPWS
jgi:hypothetical protein